MLLFDDENFLEGQKGQVHGQAGAYLRGINKGWVDPETPCAGLREHLHKRVVKVERNGAAGHPEEDRSSVNLRVEAGSHAVDCHVERLRLPRARTWMSAMTK